MHMGLCVQLRRGKSNDFVHTIQSKSGEKTKITLRHARTLTASLHWHLPAVRRGAANHYNTMITVSNIDQFSTAENPLIQSLWLIFQRQNGLAVFVWYISCIFLAIRHILVCFRLCIPLQSIWVFVPSGCSVDRDPGLNLCTAAAALL